MDDLANDREKIYRMFCGLFQVDTAATGEKKIAAVFLGIRYIHTYKALIHGIGVDNRSDVRKSTNVVRRKRFCDVK